MRWLPENRVLPALAVGWLLLVGSPVCAQLLVGASSDDHLWFVGPPSSVSNSMVLYHHAPDMEGPYYRSQPLRERPEAVAAWANRLWLIFPPTIGAEQPRRETFTLEANLNPVIGVYDYDPPDRLSVMDSLDGLGKLVGFVGTPRGPVALRVPTQRAGAGVQARDGSIASEPVLDAPVLEQLVGAGWETLPLPEDLPSRGQYRLAVGSAPANQLLLLVDSPDDLGHGLLYQSNLDDAWERVEVPVDLRRVQAVIRWGTQIPLILQGDSPGQVEIAYLRPRSLVSLGQFPVPSGRWGVFGLGDGLRLVEQMTRGGYQLRRIDPITGTLTQAEVMTSQSLLPWRSLHMPLLFAVAMTVLLLVLILRPAAKATPATLPPAMAVLTLVPRLLSLGIDLAVGGLLTILVLRCTPADLLRLPMWTADIADAAPGLWLVGITVIHGTLGEIVFGRSVGKAVFGASVITAQGARPTPGSILVRNALKLIVLLIPVLAVVALLNHHLQGLGDLMARTLVVHRVPPQN